MSNTKHPFELRCMVWLQDVSYHLLEAGANPFGDTSADQLNHPSCPLHIAISLHLANIFAILMEYGVTKNEWHDVYWMSMMKKQSTSTVAKEFQDTPPGVIVAALSTRSVPDRCLIHGSSSSTARRDIVRILLAELLSPIHGQNTPELDLTSSYENFQDPPDVLSSSVQLHNAQLANPPEKLNLGQGQFIPVAVGLNWILHLGDVEMAYAVLEDLKGHTNIPASSTPWLTRCMRENFTMAIRVACRSSWSLTRSLSFLRFADEYKRFSDLDTDVAAITMAIQYHNEAIFHYCIQQTGSIDRVLEGHSGYLLYRMIASGFSGLVPITMLLSRGVEVNWSDQDGRTPLHLAAQAGLEAEVNELLSNGAGIVSDQHGDTPFHDASKSGRVDILRSILDHAGDDMVNLLNHDHICVLSEAVIRNVPEIFQFLLERNVRLNFVKGTRAPIHWAAELGRSAFLRLLIQHGANVNCEDEAQNTPLHRSFLGKQHVEAKITKALLEAGANPCFLNTDGKAAIHCAFENLSAEAFIPILDALKSSRDAIEVKDSHRQTVLHYAMKIINVNLVRRLLHSGIKPGALDIHSQNALHLLVNRHFSPSVYDESHASSKAADLLFALALTFLLGTCTIAQLLVSPSPMKTNLWSGTLLKHICGGELRIKLQTVLGFEHLTTKI
jgi:ankyrin repeat protein